MEDRPSLHWWTIWEERIESDLKINRATFRRWNEVSSFFIFWCKGKYLEDHESIFDVLDSLWENQAYKSFYAVLVIVGDYIVFGVVFI